MSAKGETVIPANPGNRNVNSSSRLRFFLKLVWVNLSILIFIIVFLEISACFYFVMSNAISSKSTERIVSRVNSIPADAYADRSWLIDGFRELNDVNMQWEPYTYWVPKSFSGNYVNTDANGLRHTWNLPSTQSVEIYMFGGSTMWGTGARDDYTIPSFLSKMLTQAFPGRIRVVNYGRIGYVSTQEMILLFRELQRGCRPQIAIFYDGFNDTSSAMQGKAGVTLGEYNRVAEFNMLQRHSIHDLFSQVLKLSYLYQFIANTVSIDRQKSSIPLSSETEGKLANNVLKYYTMNIDLIEAAGEKMRFASLFYWQPTPYTRIGRNSFEEWWTQYYGQSQKELFSKVYADVRSSLVKNNTSFHDISDVFQGYSGTLYIDFAHTTERGNEIIASRMFRDVVPLVNQEITNFKTVSDQANLLHCR